MRDRLFPPPLTEFRCFKNLPVEIRLMIWNQASFQPRLVEIICTSFRNFKAHIYPCLTPAPALLHTCREARNEGLKIYELLPGSDKGRTYKRTYINWEVDQIYLDPSGDKMYPGRDFKFYILHAELSKNELRRKCRHIVLKQGYTLRIMFPRQAGKRLRPTTTWLPEIFPELKSVTVATCKAEWAAKPMALALRDVIGETDLETVHIRPSSLEVSSTPSRPVRFRMAGLEGRSDYRRKKPQPKKAKKKKDDGEVSCEHEMEA